MGGEPGEGMDLARRSSAWRSVRISLGISESTRPKLHGFDTSPFGSRVLRAPAAARWAMPRVAYAVDCIVSVWCVGCGLLGLASLAGLAGSACLAEWTVDVFRFAAIEGYSLFARFCQYRSVAWWGPVVSTLSTYEFCGSCWVTWQSGGRWLCCVCNEADSLWPDLACVVG